MAIIVEDGSNVANANSYNTRADFITYALARGIVVVDDESADANLINAMDFLNIQCWKGEVAYLTQALPFPRKGLVEGDTAEGYSYVVPVNIKNAQLQLAIDVRSGVVLLPSRSAEPQIKREKIGPIDTEYFAPASYVPDIPLASALITPFQCGQAFRLKTYRV